MNKRVYIQLGCIYTVVMSMNILGMSPTEQALASIVSAGRVERRAQLFHDYIENMRSRYCLDVDDVRVTLTPPDDSDPVILYTPYAALYRRVYYEMPIAYPTLTLSCNMAFFESPHLVPTMIYAAQQMLARCRQHTLLKHYYGMYPHDTTSVTYSAVRSFVEHVAQHGPAFIYPEYASEYSNAHDAYRADTARCVAACTDAPQLMAWLFKGGLISDQMIDSTSKHVLTDVLERRLRYERSS